MIVYTLAFEANNAIRARYINNEQVSELQFQPVKSLCSVYQDSYLSKYGFDLNEVEINYYKAHYTLWYHFLNNTEAEYCLIYENTVSFNVTLQEFEGLNEELSDDWEVFFPFDIN